MSEPNERDKDRDRAVATGIAGPNSDHLPEREYQREITRVAEMLRAYREEIQVEDMRLFSGLAVINKELAEEEHARAEKAERERDAAKARVKELEESPAPPSDFAKRMAMELLEAIDNLPAIETRDEWLGAVEAAIDLTAKERMRNLPDRMATELRAVYRDKYDWMLSADAALDEASDWLRREVER